MKVNMKVFQLSFILPNPCLQLFPLLLQIIFFGDVAHFLLYVGCVWERSIATDDEFREMERFESEKNGEVWEWFWMVEFLWRFKEEAKDDELWVNFWERWIVFSKSKGDEWMKFDEDDELWWMEKYPPGAVVNHEFL